MKLNRIALCVAVALFAVAPSRAQDPAADLKSLVEQIQTKMRSGQRSAEALAPELAAFDALLAKYADQKTDDVARIAFMRATLYFEVLKQPEKGREMLAQVKKDFPDTKAVAQVDRFLDSFEKRAKAQEAKSALVGKAAPELTFKWSSQEGLKKLSDLKGKVVVLDFWATWCGPCISSFPQVRELVEHYKGADVVVLGVTSIQGRVSNLEAAPIDTRNDPDKEISLLPQFMKAKNMTWGVVVSEEPVFNEAYGVTGIPHMTIIAPDGTVRHNGIHPAMPEEQKIEKIDPILKEFKLALPGQKKA